MIKLTKEFFAEVFKEACTKKPIKVTRILYASLPESMQRKEDWTDSLYNLSNDTLKEMGIFGENNTKKIQDALQKKFGSASTKFIVKKTKRLLNKWVELGLIRVPMKVFITHKTIKQILI